MKVLLFDATNAFIRSWTVVPTLDNNGEPNGAISGFLKSLASTINIVVPDKVILVWDGPGGSKKRRDMNENYKLGRKPPRPNRNYDFELENLDQNRIKQRLKLGQYLSELPVTEIVVPDIEADDVIAYLCAYYNNDEVVIASSDKDFYQLVDDRVNVFSLSRKHYMDKKEIHKLYNVYPQNFCLFRSLIGDKSDNIKGIKGIGEKKAVKFFPVLSEDKKVDVEQLLTLCEEDPEKYSRFSEQKDIIINNYKLMQLSEPIIGLASIQKIKSALSKALQFKSTSIRVKFLGDGIDQVGSYFFQVFRILSLKGKAENHT
jgi:5'-3' exonuclease